MSLKSNFIIFWFFFFLIVYHKIKVILIYFDIVLIRINHVFTTVDTHLHTTINLLKCIFKNESITQLI